MISGWEISLILITILFVVVTFVVVLYNIHPNLARRIRQCFGDNSDERTILTESEFLPPISSKPGGSFVRESSSKFVNLSNISKGTLVKDATDGSAHVNRAVEQADSPMISKKRAEDDIVARTKKLKLGVSTESQESDHIENMDRRSGVSSVGELEFTVEYEKSICELTVGINKCKGLVAFVDAMDFYATVAIGDVKEPNPVQTKLVRGTANPVFDERFPFHVEPFEIELAALLFEVHAVEKSDEHKVIGQAKVKVGDIEIKHPVKLWVNLLGTDALSHNLGDVLFSLSYLPTAQRLTVVIVKARNLSSDSAGDKLNPIVKVFLYENGERIRKKKTTVRYGTVNPNFNEAMIFQVPPSSIDKLELRILAGFEDSDGKLDLVGHLLIGPNCSGLELSHWSQMVENPRKLVSMWHALDEP